MSGKGQTVQVSVVIPVRNRFDEARQAVGSVLSQLHDRHEPTLEIIIVDESDQPLTREHLGLNEKVFSRFVRIERPTSRLGIGGSRNLGLSLSRGKYVAFLDS